jgi:hypothetical protein
VRSVRVNLSRSDAIRTLLWMGLAAAYEERKGAKRVGEDARSPVSWPPAI